MFPWYTFGVMIWIVIWCGALMNSKKESTILIYLFLLVSGIPLGVCATTLERALENGQCIDIYGKGFTKMEWDGVEYCSGKAIVNGMLVDVNYVLEDGLNGTR